MYFGNAWYPEQWEESRWSRDLELMQQAGMNVARIGEYAWPAIESVEGRIEMDWLQRAIDLAAKYGVRIVLCTPCDSPPAWLTQKYPEVLRTDEHGRLMGHGCRRHFSPASAKYRQLAADIAETMAKRFGKHPNVIGWQIGNEYCWNSYDANTRQMFQEWLAAKYGTIDEINRRWTTAYWGQTYNDFSQIPLPLGWQNPCITMEWKRFSSWVFIDFQAMQVDAIRKHAAKGQWITHNAHNLDQIDFATILKGVDRVSWDPYPGTEPIDPLKFGWFSEVARGITRGGLPHWIIEMQPGRANWQAPCREMSRGEVRNMVWHFLGHGADAALFWQWRPGPGTHEQYHGTVIAVDGEPRPLFEEIAQVGREMQAASPHMDGTTVRGQVAMLHCIPDVWAIDGQRHHNEWSTLEHMRTYYAALRAAGIDVDVIEPTLPFEKYPLVIAPNLHMLNDELVARLVKYVRGGGQLVMGARSGYKDDVNALLLSRQPGKALAELLGAHVEEFYTLPAPVSASGTLGDGKVRLWSEPLAIDADDAEPLLSFGMFNGWIDEKPAVVSRPAGKGRFTYVGTWLDEPLMAKLTDLVLRQAKVKAIFPPTPHGVEVCRRDGKAGEVFVVINFNDEVKKVKLPRPMRDALTGASLDKTLELPKRGVAVLV